MDIKEYNKLKHEYETVRACVVVAAPILVTMAVVYAFNQEYHAAWNALGVTVIASTLYETYRTMAKAVMRLYKDKEEHETI